MMSEKYPGNYFEHYIISFDTSGTEPNKTGFEELARLYVEFEGFEGFKNLIEEIETIDSNNDWLHFEKVALEYAINLDKDKLKEMAYIAIDIFDFLDI